jgi:hypothetical protein
MTRYRTISTHGKVPQNDSRMGNELASLCLGCDRAIKADGVRLWWSSISEEMPMRGADLVALVENRDVVDSQGLDIEISRKRVHPRDGAAQQQQQVSGL